MTLDLERPDEADEMYEVGPVVETVSNGRTIRITILRTVRVGHRTDWHARFEERRLFAVQDHVVTAWTELDFPSSYADDAELCLRRALRQIKRPAKRDDSGIPIVLLGDEVFQLPHDLTSGNGGNPPPNT